MRIGWFFFAAIGASAGLLCAQNTPKPVIEFVRSEVGFIRGQPDGKVDRFLGIPFAAPPIGELRWKAPQPPASWSGIRDATTPASECTQLQNTKSGPDVIGSEDCLYLNIYRPANARPRQLVPVF